MHYKHGDARAGRVERLHKIWRKMLSRCNADLPRPNPAYAGRGIRICEEWRVYSAFKAWALANGYAPDLTIERRDNDGHYEPSNCSWVTRADQTRNRRTSCFLEHGDRRLVIADWARETGIGAATIRARIQRLGWTVERALTTPPAY